MGIAKHLPVMIIAVMIAMIIMFLFSQKIADFIANHIQRKVAATTPAVSVRNLVLPSDTGL